MRAEKPNFRGAGLGSGVSVGPEGTCGRARCANLRDWRRYVRVKVCKRLPHVQHSCHDKIKKEKVGIDRTREQKGAGQVRARARARRDIVTYENVIKTFLF